MFVILYRVLANLNELPTGTTGKSLTNYSDAGNIAPYAMNAIKLFVETGIVSGDGKTLYVGNNSTRAETAQVLYNLLSKN